MGSAARWSSVARALPGDGDQFGTEAGPLPDGRFVGEHQNRVGVVDDHLQAVDRVGLIEW